MSRRVKVSFSTGDTGNIQGCLARIFIMVGKAIFRCIFCAYQLNMFYKNTKLKYRHKIYVFLFCLFNDRFYFYISRGQGGREAGR